MFRINLSMPESWRSILNAAIKQGGFKSAPSYIVETIRNDLIKRGLLK